MNELTVEVLESKIGVPALQVNIDGKNMMLHSKYNPIQEAERFIDSLNERIEVADHVLFYGIGLGYHVGYFCEQYPEKLASAYEPIPEIANLCLELQSRTAFPKEKLAHFLIEDKEDSLQENLQQLRELVHQKFVIITLPVYERLFPTMTESFSQSFRNFLLMVGNDMATVMEFSERWTINSMKNLPFTAESHSIFEKKSFFKGKPVIIVSAGPSLNEELANLKYIKENGLAYIFAVGSANKILINNNIYPDAVCTYDPQQHNYKLFEEIYNNRIKSIPMIYATTVGHETLDQYPGPLFSFITTQDNLTQQLLEKQQKPVIYDAPSIAVITLQVLNALEVSKIILVGQNFAFKQGKFYADGIERFDKEKQGFSDNAVQRQDEATIVEVEDVHNGKVRTNAHFQQMKADMEIVIQLNHMPTINTTQGGAKIEGAKFKSLKAVIEEELTQNVVDEQWYQNDMKRQKLNGKVLKQLEKECSTYISVFNEMESILKQLAGNLKVISSEQPINTLQKFERLLNDMQNTLFSKIILNPILKMDNEKLVAKLEVSNKKVSIEERLKALQEHYQTYLNTILATYKKVVPILQTHVFLKMNADQRLKFYEATCGVFHYEGMWEKKWLTLFEKENEKFYSVGIETKERGASFEFKCKGRNLQIIASNHSKSPLKIKVTIDDNEQVVMVYEKYDEERFGSFQNQIIFAVSELTNNIHEVKVEFLSEDIDLNFIGINIDAGGRVYHIHEVDRIEDLNVGKRIRCHYEAEKYQVGKFRALGKETGFFLSIMPIACPKGDFYFICVDDNKLIADRNIQNEISWASLKQAEIATSKGLFVSNKISLTLPTGGRFFGDTENDWYQYIENYSLKNSNTKNEEEYWNCIPGKTSWCLDNSIDNNDLVAVRGSYITSKGESYGEDEHYWHASLKTNFSISNGFRPAAEF
ncbi:6-hydroxymethylpterin diphosphokinase MptE-like protein [Psychrobacillus sp.]|uniref:motility associated factor glycosyltransferase family protein n=1 Tax=Psychrobacillus sp. TaxID=1871623 RepID=UPI0028BDAC6D|nr:6-hydroxymethylpterin diphosphokinase MptE-like protein [Psychrobacillus sp.]